MSRIICPNCKSIAITKRGNKCYCNCCHAEFGIEDKAIDKAQPSYYGMVKNDYVR